MVNKQEAIILEGERQIAATGRATIGEVYEAMPFPVKRRYVKTALNRAVERGRLRRVSPGVFTLVYTPPSTQAGAGRRRTSAATPAKGTHNSNEEKQIETGEDSGEASAHSTTVVAYRVKEMRLEKVDGNGFIVLPRDYAGKTVRVMVY